MKTAQHVLIFNQVWEAAAKAPFVPSGVSVLGAIEYDKSADKLRCHECGHWCANLGMHAAKAHHISSRRYKEAHGLRTRTRLTSLTLHRKLSTVNGPRLSPVRDRKTGQSKPRAGMSCYELRNMRAKCQAQLAARVKALANDIGRTPTSKQLQAAHLTYSGLSTRAIQNLAGLPHNTGQRYSIPILVELIRDFYVTNKRVPTRDDLRNGTFVSETTLTKYFGSVSAAWDAAGLGLVAKEQNRIAKSAVLKQRWAAVSEDERMNHARMMQQCLAQARSQKRAA